MDGADTTLQEIHRNRDLPTAIRAKAAIGCLPHETPRLNPVSQLELAAEPEPMALAEVVRLQRARADKMMLEPPFSDLPKVFPLRGNDNGNGSDDSGSND